MSKHLLYTIISIMSMALASCLGQITSEQNSKKAIAESLLNKDTTQTDHAKPSTNELTNIYTRAISDYIMEVNKQNLVLLDTLFLGKRNNGQPDDFPDITLPETIQNVNIQLIDPELGKKLQEAEKSRVYINLMGWVEDQQVTFIFVTFSNGFEHKFDFHIAYKYNSEQKDFEITESRIEVFNKK